MADTHAGKELDEKEESQTARKQDKAVNLTNPTELARNNISHLCSCFANRGLPPHPLPTCKQDACKILSKFSKNQPKPTVSEFCSCLTNGGKPHHFVLMCSSVHFLWSSQDLFEELQML